MTRATAVKLHDSAQPSQQKSTPHHTASQNEPWGASPVVSAGSLNCAVLYHILKPLMRLAAWLAYRRIVCTGLERLENGKPTLILANHSASFMDAMLVAVFARRRIHFFARGDVFENPLASKILHSLGLMPVFRVSEGKENMHRNEDTNTVALKVLHKGGAVLIFAEGVSALEKMLKPLKKGPFRLAALAAAAGDAPVIMPLGINYVTPARPGGDVFIVAGNALDTATFYREAKGNEARLAMLSMRATELELAKIVWNARDKNAAQLADAALLALQQSSDAFSFNDAADVIARVNDVPDESDGEAQKAGPLLPEGDISQVSIVEWLSTMLHAPFAMMGLGFHYVPVRAAKLIADSKVKEPDFYAPVLVGAAVLLVLLWYLLAAVLLIIFWKVGLLLLPLTALCGILYRKYWSNLPEA